MIITLLFSELKPLLSITGNLAISKIDTQVALHSDSKVLPVSSPFLILHVQQFPKKKRRLPERLPEGYQMNKYC